MSKLATLLLFTIVLVLSSLVVVGFSFAQSIPKPSVPEFTLKYVDNSYDVPPTYGVDQYTGKTVMTQAGYHVENKSIVVTITNQHFSPYEDANGKTLQLYYNIRWKGHFGDYWGDYNSSRRMLLSPYSRFDDEGFPIPNDPFKVATFALGNDTKNSNSVSTIRDVSADGQVDFQVQAYIGYYTVVQGTPVPPFRTLNIMFLLVNQAVGATPKQYTLRKARHQRLHPNQHFPQIQLLTMNLNQKTNK